MRLIENSGVWGALAGSLWILGSLAGSLRDVLGVPEQVARKELGKAWTFYVQSSTHQFYRCSFACEETLPEGFWKGLGPQGRGKNAARGQQKKKATEEQQGIAREPQSTNKFAREQQARHRSNKCPRQARIIGRVHFTRVVWASTVRFETTTATSDVRWHGSRQSEHVFHLSTFLTHVRPCMKHRWRMHFHRTLTQLRWLHPMLVVIAALICP